MSAFGEGRLDKEAIAALYGIVSCIAIPRRTGKVSDVLQRRGGHGQC